MFIKDIDSYLKYLMVRKTNNLGNTYEFIWSLFRIIYKMDIGDGEQYE
jgi:myosin-crossreactive antigen